jgi:hypothetical protein
MPLLGRWIRVERAEAHRTLLLRPIEPWTLVHQSSEEGKRWVAIDEKGERNYDVYTWMKQYGELESITERTIEGIGEDGEKTSGVDIKFRHRDDSIFALNVRFFSACSYRRRDPLLVTRHQSYSLRSS